MLITAILFFILLSVLIVSHECGHFFTARAFGIRVDEFGFGLPPRAIGFVKKGTMYSLNWLPFGGFVRIHGEEGDGDEDTDSFASKSGLARSLVLLAGVAANFFLAFVLMSIVISFGVPEAVDESEVVNFPDAKIAIVGVAPSGPAEKAGIQAGDYVRIVQAEDAIIVKPQKISDIQNLINRNAGKDIVFKVKRNGTDVSANISVRKDAPAGEGLTGIELAWVHTKIVPWYMSPIDGARVTFQMTRETVLGLWGVIKSFFVRGAPSVEVTGPVGIFNLVGSMRHSGIGSFLMFAAALSINLGLINVLPIPGLDGGRFLFVVIESIRRKRISSKVSALTHGIGFVVLLILMILITYLDIAKIF